MPISARVSRVLSLENVSVRAPVGIEYPPSSCRAPSALRRSRRADRGHLSRRIGKLAASLSRWSVARRSSNTHSTECVSTFRSSISSSLPAYHVGEQVGVLYRTENAEVGAFSEQPSTPLLTRFDENFRRARTRAFVREGAAAIVPTSPDVGSVLHSGTFSGNSGCNTDSEWRLR